MDFLLFYFIVFIAYSWAVFISNKHNKIIRINSCVETKRNRITNSLFIVSVLYVLIRTFVYDTGQDYHYYYTHYYYTAKNNFDEWGENREIGYRIIVYLLSRVEELPVSFFCFCALITVVVWNKIVTMYAKAGWIIMSFWWIYMFILSMNIYRQYCAIAFIMFAYYLLFHKQRTQNPCKIDNEKVRKKYVFFKRLKRSHIFAILLLGIAVLFHTSAIIGILIVFIVYLFRNFPSNKYIFISMIVIATIAANTFLSSYLEMLSMVSRMYENATSKVYEMNEMADTVWDKSRMTYVIMIVHIIYVWYADKLKKTSEHFRFLYYVMVLTFVFFPMSQQEILLRIRTYLTAFIPMSLGYTVYINFRKNTIAKNLPLLGAVMFDVLYFGYQMYLHSLEFPLQFENEIKLNFPVR